MNLIQERVFNNYDFPKAEYFSLMKEWVHQKFKILAIDQMIIYAILWETDFRRIRRGILKHALLWVSLHNAGINISILYRGSEA